MANFCRKCGTRLTPNAKFCPNCGQPTAHGSTVSGQASGSGPARPALTPGRGNGQTFGMTPDAPRAPQAKSRAGLCILLSAVMVLELALIAFWQPGLLRSDRKEPAVSVASAQNNASQTGNAGSQNNGQAVPGNQGGSGDIHTFEACEGVTINVPENALYEDTVITIEPVTEDTPHIREIINDFYEQDLFALRAWEVDAGLEADECLPGPYEVILDLDALGIPNSLRDSLSVYRISDEGEYSEIISSVEGNKLTYSSRQNSIEMMLYSSRKTIEKYYQVNLWPLDILEHKTKCYYMAKLAINGSFFYTTNVTTDYGSFNVTWTHEDLDPDHAAKARRMAEISENYKKAIHDDTTVEKRSSWDVFGLFSSNATEAELLEQALEKDEEYQKLKKEYHSPKILDQIISYISIAFYFLATHEKIEMPETTVNFYLLDDIKSDTLGNNCWSWGAQSFVEINMRDIWKMVKENDEGKMARENLSLTVTHELFHVCQENYHTHFFSDSVRFDEMTAVVLESDARDYYFENGIISQKPPLTNQHHWNQLKKSTDDNSLNKDMQTDQGYNLSLYYEYLREKTGKKAPVAEIMNARSYFEVPKTSKILSEVFGLTEEEYQKHWSGFCKKYRKAAAALNIDRNIVEPNKGLPFDLMNTEDYAMRTVGLEQKIKTPMPLLVIADNISTVSSQRASYLPAVTYSVYKQGYYIPAQEGSTVSSSNYRRHITEIYGKQDGKTSPGYTVWGFGQTPKAKIEINKDKNCIEIYMSEESELAKKGHVEGYLIKVETDSGFKAQEHKTLEETKKGISISFDKIYNGDQTKDVEITVTMCEYVSDKEGNHYYGIESEALNETIGEAGVWELQGVRYESHWKWTGKNGGTIGERWTELKINENATAYSYITTEGGESKDGSGKLPGAVVTAEQLAETFTDKMVLAVIAYLIEDVPEGYDFGKTDIRDLDKYKKETRYLFQEAGAGRQSLFRTSAANANANGGRVLMIGMPVVTLIYRERPSDTASDSTWHIYPVEKIDKWN